MMISVAGPSGGGRRGGFGWLGGGGQVDLAPSRKGEVTSINIRARKGNNANGFGLCLIKCDIYGVYCSSRSTPTDTPPPLNRCSSPVDAN